MVSRLMELYERNTRCMDHRGTVYRADVYVDMAADTYHVLTDRVRPTPYQVKYDPESGGWWDEVVPERVLSWTVFATSCEPSSS